MLACLGHTSRFEMVRQLLETERCVSELAVVVGLSQSCTTRHLQALQRHGLVCGARAGKRVMFHLCLDQPEVRALLAWATAEIAALPDPGPDESSAGIRPRRRPGGSRRANQRRRGAAAERGDGTAPRRTPSAVTLPVAEERMDPAPNEAPAPPRPAEMEDWLL
jgi:DNA-binding transcriptional ArsR family regulator